MDQVNLSGFQGQSPVSPASISSLQNLREEAPGHQPSQEGESLSTKSPITKDSGQPLSMGSIPAASKTPEPQLLTSKGTGAFANKLRGQESKERKIVGSILLFLCWE